MRAAGVVGDVAADGARLLARRIRRVVVAARADLPGEVQVHQPGLDDRDLVLVIDLDDAVHPHQRDDDTAFGRQTAAGESGAGAARDERNPFPVGQAHDRGDVLGRGREHDEIRQRAEQRQPIGLVDQELVGVAEHGAASDDRFQLDSECEFPGVRDGGHDGRIIPSGGAQDPAMFWRSRTKRSISA